VDQGEINNFKNTSVPIKIVIRRIIKIMIIIIRIIKILRVIAIK